VLLGGFHARNYNTTPAIIGNQNAVSTYDKVYFHIANEYPSSYNSHTVTGFTVRDCLLEVFGNEPNPIILPATAGDGVYTNNVFVGIGDLVSNTADLTTSVLVENNTSVLFQGGNVAGTYLAETKVAPTTPVLRNNLQAILVDTPAAAMIRNVATAVGTLHVDSDYNAIHNTINFIRPDHDIVYDAGYDEHSIRIDDPEFVDPSRLLVGWAQLYLGDASAGWREAYNLLLSMNGYDAATGQQVPANADITLPKQAYDWVKAGYVPQNMVLATAGEGGTYIGAIAPEGEIPEEFTTVGVVYTSGLPYGSSPNINDITSIIDLPSGWEFTAAGLSPSEGRLEIKSAAQVHYVLETADSTQDSFTLRIVDDSGAIGLLHASIEIMREDASLVVPSGMQLKSGDSEEFPITFNAFANRPAEFIYDVGDTHNLIPDQLFREDGIEGVLVSDLLYEGTGPGGGGGIFAVSASPKFPYLLFCACDMAGTYRSIDDGETW